ncbi:MAG: hypothetical protein ACXVRJ_13765 [Gaiellaceae bacterium]
MTEPSLVHAAARNNADWCDAFCRAHAVEGHFSGSCWSSPVRTPPLYPDAVTLRQHVAVEELLTRIDHGAGCSVKDSFSDLDLTAAGFRLLFDAAWLYADSLEPSQDGWAFVRDRDELVAWSLAWGERPQDLGFFPPSLLDDPSVRILVRADADGVIVAGAVANRSAGMIGLSNLFDLTGDLEAVWRGAAMAALAVLEPLPLVAYDGGVGLEAAHRAGFDTLGELRVWLAP